MPADSRTHRAPRRQAPGPSVSASVAVVLALAGCGTSPTSAAPAQWSEAAEAISGVLVEESVNYQTVGPDPALRGDPPRVESSRSRLRASVVTIRQRVETVAARHEITVSCTPVTRAQALRLMAAQATTALREGTTPSAVCNFTREGEEFGFVVLDALTAETTGVWYVVGPDGAHQQV